MKKIFLIWLHCAILYGSSPFESPLTLEEKVGQLLMVHFQGENANEEAKKLIQEIKVGGIIYYTWSNGLSSPEQIKLLSEELQHLSPIPLLIATDQEGGIVTRASKGFTVFPGNKSLGMTGDPTLAEQAAIATGLELLSVGINMNLAPVIDVNNNPKNPIIGIRSFGENPQTVASFGKQALNGYKKAGIIATLKHFPGHGDVEIDSHVDLPIVHKSMEELEEMELIPFSLLASQADAIMTAHLQIPAFDKNFCSTLSKKTLSYLRNHLHFQGVILSDSLVMEGVLKQCASVDDAAIQALNAGCDILLLGGRQLIGGNEKYELTSSDIERIRNSIVQAVKEGVISEKRIDEAVKRILQLKKNYLERSSFHLRIEMGKHQTLSQEIARLAIRETYLNSNQALRFADKNIEIVAPELLKASLQDVTLKNLGKTKNIVFYEGLSPTPETIRHVKKQTESADIVLIFVYNLWKYPSQKELIDSISKSGKQLVLMDVRDPMDPSLFPNAQCISHTFSPTTVSIQAAIDLLCEKENLLH